MDAEKAATILWRARLAEEPLEALPDDCAPRSLEEGYVIQRAMVAVSGRGLLGWKIAATSEAGQKHIGVDGPIVGRLFSGFTLDDGATIPAGKMHMRVVEAEFAFRLGVALPRRDEAYTLAEVTDAVSALHLAIEIPDARFQRFAAAGGAQIAADDAYASWFVLGSEVPAWRSLDLAAQKTLFRCDGEVVSEGSGATVLGHPLVALTWLVNFAAEREGGVQPGDVVTTGTALPPPPLVPGDRFVAEFDGLGSVRVDFS